MGCLEVFLALLRHTEQIIVKKAAWTIRNIDAGNQDQIQALVVSDEFVPIIHVLDEGDPCSLREAAKTIANYTSGGCTEQIVHIVQMGVSPYLCKLLDSHDAKMLLVLIDALYNILKCAEKLGQVDRVGQMVEEYGSVDKLEKLQDRENMDIYKKTLEIVERFFSADDNPLSGDEVTGTDAFQFNDNNSIPGEGFSF